MHKKSLLQAALDTFEEGICVVDEDGRLQTLNAAASTFLGRRPEELAGLRVVDVFPSDDLARHLKSLLVTGQPYRNEQGHFKRKDSILPMTYDLAPIQEWGQTRGALLRFRETPQPEICDSALRDSEAKLRAILDTIMDGVIAVDGRGIIQVFNPAAEHLFGYRCEEVLGHNVNILMPSPDRETHNAYIANYLQTGIKKIIGIGREVIGKRKDGSLFPIHLSIGEARLGKQPLFVAVLHDLTARKRAEEILLTLSSAVEQSPNAVLIASVDGVIEYINPSFTRLTGYTADEVVGRTPSLLQSGLTSPAKYQRLWQTLTEGREWREEIQDRKKSGELYWAQETISPIRNASGVITHFLAIHQDITELKKDKQALQESEERFRQMAEMTGEWLWEQDPEGCYIYSSTAVREILGYSPAEILGKRYLDLLTEDDKKYWAAEMPPTPFLHQRFYRLVNRYRHKNGQEVFTESTGEPILDSGGRVVKWRGVDHNITARKRYEDALRLRDRAIEAASVGIHISDANEQGAPNIYVNAALSRITGYTREELLGHNMRLLYGPDTDSTAKAEIERALGEGGSCALIMKNYRKDRTPFWNELLIAPVRDEGGKLTHFIGVHTDVTELRQAAEERHELEIAKEIQLSLLPKAPLNLTNARVAGIYLPATHIGGDYYDYFHDGDFLDMVIADVSGHSVGAALIMAEARSALKAETRKTAAGQSDHGAAEILLALNDLLHEDLNGADIFITMFYLRYDLASRRLRYANAGHNCALLLRVDETRCQELDADGMIMGVRKQVEFEEKSLYLRKGDRVLLYTDGVTEAQNQDGEFFGVARLCELFMSYRRESPETVIGELLQALRNFRAARPFDDDLSMVVLEAQ